MILSSSDVTTHDLLYIIALLFRTFHSLPDYLCKAEWKLDNIRFQSDFRVNYNHSTQTWKWSHAYWMDQIQNLSCHLSVSFINIQNGRQTSREHQSLFSDRLCWSVTLSPSPKCFMWFWTPSTKKNFLHSVCCNTSFVLWIRFTLGCRAVRGRTARGRTFWRTQVVH